MEENYKINGMVSGLSNWDAFYKEFPVAMLY